jgi:multidrug transporter EmrE-like cation transporter
MMNYVFFLIFAVLLNAGSNVFYKYSSLNSQEKMLSLVLIGLGLLLGAVNAVFYTRSLKGISLNIAYPIFSAGSIILVTLISIFVFKESITVLKIVGISVITLGVIVVSL